MKLGIVLLLMLLFGVFVACKKGGVQSDVDAAIASQQYQFIALLGADGKFVYPQVPGIPDWYFQTTGIRIQQTKPETREADLAYQKNYNDTLYAALKAQGKLQIIEENVARVKANLDKAKQ